MAMKNKRNKAPSTQHRDTIHRHLTSIVVLILYSAGILLILSMAAITLRGISTGDWSVLQDILEKAIWWVLIIFATYTKDIGLLKT